MKFGGPYLVSRGQLLATVVILNAFQQQVKFYKNKHQAHSLLKVHRSVCAYLKLLVDPHVTYQDLQTVEELEKMWKV